MVVSKKSVCHCRSISVSMLNLLKKDADGQSPVRIFEQKEGEYYTVFGKDAENLAETFFSSKEVLKSKDSIPSVHIQRGRLGNLLKLLLLERSKHVHMFVKDSSGHWTCSKRASPGNLQNVEDMLFNDTDAVDSSVIMAVQMHFVKDQLELGLAFVDTSQKKIAVCEFTDNDLFSVLESVLVQQGAKECLLPPLDDAHAQSAKLRQVLERCSIPISEQKKTDFKSSDIERSLEHIVGSVKQHLAELEKTRAMEALSSLIKYLNLGVEDANASYEMEVIDLGAFMRLDTSAIRALNLFPSANDANKSSSVFGLLNHCRTAAGTRCLRQWIKQPLIDLNAIRERHDLVECFVSDSELCKYLHDDGLKRIPDLARLSKRLADKKANLQDCIGLYTFVVRLPMIIQALEEFKGDNEAAELLKRKFTDPLRKVASDFTQFENMIEQTIDLDAAQRHEYLVNPQFSPELEQLRDAKVETEEQIEILRVQIAEEIGLPEKSVKLNHKAGPGHHFRITRKDEKKIRGCKTYLTLETRKDGVRFTTVAMKHLSKAHDEHSKTYDRLQKGIVDKCVSIVASYSPVINKCHNVITPLDVLVSFAVAAMNAPEQYVRPEMKEMAEGTLQLSESRHPCLEVQEHVNSFIANDVSFNDQAKFHIISGPNMGGKSTYIRQIGVIVLMAQIGSYVPCSRAVISVVDCILARVGAGDCQLRGVSTFMAEMLEAAAIIKTATPNSLIIVDELGRGTSTYDGFGLAWSISEYIAKRIGCNAVFATHFHELTALAQHCPKVVNHHVTASTEEGTITMLYEVRDGPCDRSFGIHVAELAKFPDTVVQMAKRKATELESFGQSREGSPSKKQNMRDVVERFKALPMTEMSDQEVLEAVQQLSNPQDLAGR